LYGGAERVVVQQAKAFINHGWETKIIACDSQPHKEYEGLNIILPEEKVNWKIRGSKSSDIFEILQTYKALRELAEEYVDWADVYIANSFPSQWSIPRRFKDRSVWQCNEIPDLWHAYKPNATTNLAVWFGRYYDRMMISGRVGRAVVADRQNAKLFVERYGFRPEIVPYGVDGQYFSEPLMEKESEILQTYHYLKEEHRDYPAILQVGMISPSKNQLELLQALKLLKREYKDAQVLFAGIYSEGDSYYRFLREYVRKNELQNNVVFLGHIEREELRILYRLVDIGIFPGKGQGSWLSPLEVLVSGKCVIVSDKLPCSDLLCELGFPPYVGGIAESPALLFDRILHMYEDYECWLDKARDAKQYILSNMTWKHYTDRIIKIIESHDEGLRV
jgi:glycosyltransferase involved in cell wall biosynthesis